MYAVVLEVASRIRMKKNDFDFGAIDMIVLDVTSME